VFTFESRTARAQVHDLRWEPASDGSVTLVGGALWVAGLALWPQLSPRSCRWCEVNALDGGVRDALVWRDDPHLAGDLSDAAGFMLAPAAAYGLDLLAASHDQARQGWGVDALLITEATFLALDANLITKVLVARERPDVHAAGAAGGRLHTDDDDVSFSSGHATETFAFAAATGTVSTLRGYRWAADSWIAGGVIAAGTAYLRIAADRHWLTDVLVGMITGVCIGVAVPLLFHQPVGE
jgi:hypothetical protein